MRRDKRIQYLAELAGSKVARVVDSRDGWPGLMEIFTPVGIWKRVEVHVGYIGRSGRGRDESERRFQNPANKKPMSSPSGAPALLVGMWERGPRIVLVGMETDHRIGVATRKSLFFPVDLLDEVAAVGWGERYSSVGEHIIGFIPSLLPVYIECRVEGVKIQPDRVSSILDAAGLRLDKSENTPEERARRAASQIVRRSAFSKAVIAAYGERCSLCDLNLGLLEGAHIYPVSAPGSWDEVWNGLALCRNHHAAFDKHQLWIDPGTYAVRLHPDLESYRSSHPPEDPSRRFLEATRDHIRLPGRVEDAPRLQMFRDRYRFYSKSYGWA